MCFAATSIAPAAACDDVHEEALSKMASICEAKIKARLKAPATYQRASVQESALRMTAAEYKDKELTRMRDNISDSDAWRDAYKKLDSDIAAIERSPESAPMIFETRIAYDAQNGFGALLRGHALCTLISSDGDEENIDEGAVAAVIE
ncbi:hypothetical protein CEJ86_27390 [Sinorhizobium meliloti]|uniref:Uncharacterized protein n=2 Tax=Rhizobium meliloti TaxID=382 RepID=A0A2J0YVR5_RHIML|nr:hypothetical protein CEJ86_27390 [Sinorhizobium meliloti]